MRNRDRKHCVYMGSDKDHCACGFSQATIQSLFLNIASKNYTPNDLRNLAGIIKNEAK